MFNFFKKPQYGNVAAFSFSPFFEDYISFLKPLSEYLKIKYNLSLDHITYCNNNNKDISGLFSNFKNIQFNDVQLLHLGVNENMDSEILSNIGCSNFDKEVLIYCMINSEFEMDLRELYMLMDTQTKINYAFQYQVKLNKGIVNAYLLDSQDANRNVVGLAPARISVNKLQCFRKNQHALLEGIIKEIFLKNIINRLHFNRIKDTEFYNFITEKTLFDEIRDGIFYFEFSSHEQLLQAQEIAYKEKIVLCP